MINLEIKDKFELNALHKALMEAKFHDNPNQPIVQSSPMVANVMNKVVDELEKINWATEADKKYKKIQWKNTWKDWRENPSEEMVLPVLRLHVDDISKMEGQAKIDYLRILASPYKVSDELLLELHNKASQ